MNVKVTEISNNFDNISRIKCTDIKNENVKIEIDLPSSVKQIQVDTNLFIILATTEEKKSHSSIDFDIILNNGTLIMLDSNKNTIISFGGLILTMNVDLNLNVNEIYSCLIRVSDS